MNSRSHGQWSEVLERAVAARSARVAVIGLGYVGLPLATAVGRRGFRVTGIDIDASKIVRLQQHRSYIEAVTDTAIAELFEQRQMTAESGYESLHACDVVIICVPTPLTHNREPDLSFVTTTAEQVARHLRRGQLVVLESTSFPGTTTDVLKPILEKSGLVAGADFFLGYSPEREDPGNALYPTTRIPKLVSGDGPIASRLVAQFYGAVFDRVVPVSDTRVAEAAKITENVFRAVNIALVNELKVIYDAMDIDIWEVIAASATKPFGYMPFYPGPGLGGHCIPIDPFYLSWKSKQYDLPARLIELAGEINVSMPRYVLARLERLLDTQLSLSLSSARVLIVGVAYKRNIADLRESPALKLIDLLDERGVRVSFHDPMVLVIPSTRMYARFAGLKSVELSGLNDYDAVLIVTDHDEVDYAWIAREARLVIDTRNVFARRGLGGGNIFKA